MRNAPDGALPEFVTVGSDCWRVVVRKRLAYPYVVRDDKGQIWIPQDLALWTQREMVRVAVMEIEREHRRPRASAAPARPPAPPLPPPHSKPRRRIYPADALGVRVEVVDATLFDDDDGSTIGAKIMSDDLILVCGRYPVEVRRQAAAVSRRTILEMGLPAAEMEAYAADLADLARKLGPLSAAAACSPEGYALKFDPQARRWWCPCCGKGYRLYNTYLWNHLRKHGLEPAGGGRWAPAKREREVSDGTH